MLKSKNIIGNCRITREQEYTLMFIVVALNIVGNYLYFRYIINFHADTFFIIVGIISFLIFLSFFKEIYKFVKNLDYIAFFRRLTFSFLIGFFLTELIYIPYFIRTNIYADSRPMEEYTLPITSVYIGRVGRSGIYYNFKGTKNYIGYDGKTVSDIEREGLSRYCFSLKVKQGLDGMYIIQTYDIIRCNSTLYE